jgi:uncharacterized protein
MWRRLGSFRHTGGAKEGAMTEPAGDSEILGGRERPMCPLCGNGTFRREEGKFDSAWGLTAHRVEMLICGRCSYVLTFYEGNTIFDFDFD